jgi:PAT family beta-lactamase induction signal transducer AmpG
LDFTVNKGDCPIAAMMGVSIDDYRIDINTNKADYLPTCVLKPSQAGGQVPVIHTLKIVAFDYAESLEQVMIFLILANIIKILALIMLNNPKPGSNRNLLQQKAANRCATPHNTP